MTNQWVTDCYKCNVENVFKEIVKIVKEDVRARETLNKKLNKEKEKEDSSRILRKDSELPETFHTSQSEDKLTLHVKFGVEGGNLDPLCSISLKGDYIAIEMPSRTGFKLEAEIRTCWDIDHAQCLLTIADKEDPIRRDDLWKIVQGFLKPVFFPDR